MSESRFWVEGPVRLRRALRDRRNEIDSLISRIQSASDPSERIELERELLALLREYRPTEQELSSALFLMR